MDVAAILAAIVTVENLVSLIQVQINLAQQAGAATPEELQALRIRMADAEARWRATLPALPS